MLGHITYLSREAMMQKFDADRLAPRDVATQFETKFSVGSYLAYQGDRFGERFDANSYLTLTMAMDLFDLGGTPEQLTAALGPARCRWLVSASPRDWLFPPFQSQQMVDALLATSKPVSYCNVESQCGHDAFLLPNDLDTYGELMEGFLANLSGGESPHVGADAAGPAAPVRPASSTIAAAGLRLDRRADPAGGQRAGPGLRHGRLAVAPAAARATGGSWASNWTSRPSWPASAADWTSSRPT